MTEEDDGVMWPPTMFKGFQEAGEEALKQQQNLMRQMMSANSNVSPPSLATMSQTATFKTRVQSGGRISIPDAEREALDIEEGDIVQTVVIPVKRNRDSQSE